MSIEANVLIDRKGSKSNLDLKYDEKENLGGLTDEFFGQMNGVDN